MVASIIALLGAGLSAGFLALAATRRKGPGRRIFFWMALAIGSWCLTSALHTAVASVEGRILIARFQYIGIMATPALLLGFAQAYVGQPLSPRQRWLLGIVPALTVAAAWTNNWHGLLWSAIAPVSAEPGARLRYSYGAWFYVALLFNYAVLAAAALTLARAAVRQRGDLRKQVALLLAGLVAPWAANIVYLTWLRGQSGLDLTPISFTLTLAVIGYALFRYRLFDLIPAARDRVVENLADAVFVLDLEDRVIDANRAALQLLDSDASHVIGCPVAQLVPNYAQIAHAVDRAGDLRVEVALGPPEAPRSFALRISTVQDDRGQLTGRAIVVHEVTDFRRAQAELIAAREAAEAASRAKSNFVSRMSHELRTPLNVVIGYSDLLLERSESEQAEDLQRIRDAGLHLLALINAVLDFSKLEDDALQVGRERVPVLPIVQEVADVVRPLCTDRGNRLHLELPAEPLFVEADSLRLRQVLFNLLANAAKFTRDGCVRLRVTCVNCDLGASAPAPEPAEVEAAPAVVFEVCDTGVGMAQGEIERLFEPFTQADESLSRRYDGAGLGLALSQRLCRLMGGTISVASELGRGSTFTVMLPLAPPPAADPRESRAGL